MIQLKNCGCAYFPSHINFLNLYSMPSGLVAKVYSINQFQIKFLVSFDYDFEARLMRQELLDRAFVCLSNAFRVFSGASFEILSSTFGCQLFKSYGFFHQFDQIYRCFNVYSWLFMAYFSVCVRLHCVSESACSFLSNLYSALRMLIFGEYCTLYWNPCFELTFTFATAIVHPPKSLVLSSCPQPVAMQSKISPYI